MNLPWGHFETKPAEPTHFLVVRFASDPDFGKMMETHPDPDLLLDTRMVYIYHGPYIEKVYSHILCCDCPLHIKLPFSLFDDLVGDAIREQKIRRIPIYEKDV